MTGFVLVHSPLVGPLTWARVADELRSRGIDAVVPSLAGAEEAGPPYWTKHVERVVEAVRALGAASPLILSGHSGGGPLLPAIGRELGDSIGGYVFVDAGLPRANASRLDLFESGQAAASFRAAASRGGMLPTWTEKDLQGVIGDPALRSRFVEELRPVPLAMYEEPLPVPGGWPDAPCAYLRFGSKPVYEEPARDARARSWPYEVLEGEHFHMLVDPPAVVDALLRLTRSMDLTP